MIYLFLLAVGIMLFLFGSVFGIWMTYVILLVDADGPDRAVLKRLAPEDSTLFPRALEYVRRRQV